VYFEDLETFDPVKAVPVSQFADAQGSDWRLLQFQDNGLTHWTGGNEVDSALHD
jgi:hypothetical protein